jgi:hypothetical protein
LRGFLFQSFSAGSGQLVVFGAAAIFASRPLGADPAILFELVKRGIERSLPYLENLAGHLTNALGDGPTMHGFEGDGFEDEQVEGALHEAGWFTQEQLLSVTDNRILLLRTKMQEHLQTES